ncbi:MAG: 3-phosphoshikimate 1-carboxyvinyltransferase [Bacteroidales bacterium]|nr:3-phosphoshikimate 1-carboxyvinyltransferase [Bacteroidales bacterium]
MEVIVYPGTINGTLTAPPSKSAAQRAIIIASLAPGDSQLWFPGSCKDVIAVIKACQNLGASITQSNHTLNIKGGITLPSGEISCGESGLGIRILSAVASTFSSEVVLTAEGTLRQRKMDSLSKAIIAMGAECITKEGKAPVSVKGPLKGGTAHIDGQDSSQVLSGLLIAAPLALSDVHLIVDNLKSIPYIDLSLQMMKSFGVEVKHEQYKEFYIKAPQTYKPSHITIEGDWSSASFLLVAGAIAGRITVTNLNPESAQADKKILDALALAGANIHVGPHEVTVSTSSLKAFEFDASHCPDLFPPLLALASCCEGESIITGTDRLHNKESNRAFTLYNEFGKMGVPVRIENNIMRISGCKIKGAHTESHSDHRIAMACAVGALRASGPVSISGAEAVNKSYPDFFEQLNMVINSSRT